jgi:hypothetical protein
MNDDRRREIETVIELTSARLDLKFTKALGDLKLDITNAINEKLSACQTKHEKMRRWSIGTWISIIGPIVAFVSAVAAYMR